ncbi:endonuclease-reverse transcriptase [Elysia marginata]|uniref:Endonuclease-reverse transcriptase n=1 Tax=Elysia marginata TaxID=1093978 RepID=A0AAV4HNT8_9GAST|nr:endonuclease-reverse transcriptase [Elysia marginata]
MLRKTFLFALLLHLTCTVTYGDRTIPNAGFDNTSKTTPNACDEICTTINCLKEADSLSKHMNFDADPCEEFDEFACGNFYKEKRIPRGSKLIESSTPLSKRNKDIIKEVLLEEIKPTDRPFQKLPKIFLKSCVDSADEIPAEVLQALGTSGKEEITTLTNDKYKTGLIPKDFISGAFVALPKANKATNCFDQRTISLISRALKILLRVIMNRINPIIDKNLDDTQLGFRKGKGTRDGIFLLRNTFERMMDCQKDLNLCFIDYAKVFDRVNHEKLIEVLAKARIPSHERQLGCIVSPSLFNLYKEYLLQEGISEKSGIIINGVNINNIRYANDIVIVAESEEQLQAMLDCIVDKCKEYGMEINAKKTKTMHTRRDTKTPTITVGNAVLEQVSKYS